MSNNGITKFAFWLIVGIATQSIIVGWVWNNVLAQEFAVHHLAFGKVFMLVVAVRVLLFELTGLSGLRKELAEIKQILSDTDANSKFQFSSLVELLRAAIQERDSK